MLKDAAKIGTLSSQAYTKQLHNLSPTSENPCRHMSSNTVPTCVTFGERRDKRKLRPAQALPAALPAQESRHLGGMSTWTIITRSILAKLKRCNRGLYRTFGLVKDTNCTSKPSSNKETRDWRCGAFQLWWLCFCKQLMTSEVAVWPPRPEKRDPLRRSRTTLDEDQNPGSCKLFVAYQHARVRPVSEAAVSVTCTVASFKASDKL